MSSPLRRVTGRAPAVAAGLLVLAAAVPATAHAAESAPVRTLTSASVDHQSEEAGTAAASDDAAAKAAEAAEVPEAAESAEGKAESSEAAAVEPHETPEVAEKAEEAAESGVTSGYWEAMGAGSGAKEDAEAEAAEAAASSEEAAEKEHSFNGSHRPEAEAPKGNNEHHEAAGNEHHEAAGPAESHEHAPAPAPSPIQGRTEGGSIILTDGDIVACAGVGDLRIVGADGTERLTNGPGTHFTTPAGTDVLTLSTGHVRVTVGGASAEIQCGPELFPTVVGLPRTGPGADAAMLALAGFGLVAAGGAAVAATRRTRRPVAR